MRFRGYPVYDVLLAGTFFCRWHVTHQALHDISFAHVLRYKSCFVQLCGTFEIGARDRCCWHFLKEESPEHAPAISCAFPTSSLTAKFFLTTELSHFSPIIGHSDVIKRFKWSKGQACSVMKYLILKEKKRRSSPSWHTLAISRVSSIFDDSFEVTSLRPIFTAKLRHFSPIIGHSDLIERRIAKGYPLTQVEDNVIALISSRLQVVQSRWQTPAASPTSEGPETDRWRRWRLPAAWPARPRPSGAPWKSRNPLAFTIPASRPTARPCLETVLRKKCAYRHTRRRFSDYVGCVTVARCARRRCCRRWFRRRSFEEDRQPLR